MDSRSLKLDEFIAEYRFWGEWEVSYTDGTHLPKDEYVKLGDITVDADEEIARCYPILPFTFSPVPDKKIKCRFSELSKDKKEEGANSAKKIIRDQLADSMVRTGLLRPNFCLMEEQIVEMRFRGGDKKDRRTWLLNTRR